MHLVFVVNHVAFFVSHRLPIALEAKRRGWRVTVLTGQPGSESMERLAMKALGDAGVVHHRFGFGSSTLNPLRELWALLGMCWVLRRLRPDVVHCASPKGVIYGGIAARICRVPALVLAVSGMGYAFTGGDAAGWRRRILGSLITVQARLAFRHRNRKVIVQNTDDRNWIIRRHLCPPEDIELIPGSGVDLVALDRDSPNGKQPIVVFPARLLRDKGVTEFVQAVRLIRGKVSGWRFVLAGAGDYRNPSCVSRAEIEGWVSEGVVEWSGHVDDMTSLLSEASIVCLPSHREGLPKALLEAAAAGCAVVTTDAIGCRESIVAGKTGDLVAVGNIDALAEALLALILDTSRRQSYGTSGRLLAREKFGLESVLAAIFDLYAALLRRT